MAYPVLADFRTATLAAYCQGLALATAEIADALLTATIARMVSRLESATNDSFIQATPVTYDLRGEGTRALELPQRCTAVTTVKTRDYLGNLTTQSALAYRLVSSLDSAGANRVNKKDLDYLEIVPWQYLSGIVGEPWWRWPSGPNTVQVIGTFGWTVTPTDINRAVALMTYDAAKAQASNLRRAARLETADAIYSYNTEDADHPTGINEADDIIRDYQRSTGLLVG